MKQPVPTNGSPKRSSPTHGSLTFGAPTRRSLDRGALRGAVGVRSVNGWTGAWRLAIGIASLLSSVACSPSAQRDPRDGSARHEGMVGQNASATAPALRPADLRRGEPCEPRALADDCDSAPRAPEHAAQVHSEPTPPPSPEYNGPEAQVPAPLAVYVRQIERALDPSTLSYVEQPPSNGPITLAREGLPFPQVKFARVRAFTFNFMSPFASGPHGSGGYATALDQDGQFTPTVNLPGVLLDEQTAALLLLALEVSDEAPAYSLSGFRFRHAYVFYDERDRPVAQFATGNGDTIWTLSNARIPSQARAILAEVCERSGVGLCSGDETLERRAWQFYNARELVKPRSTSYKKQRYRYRAPPVEPSSSLAALTPRDKRLLCAWNDHHLSVAFSTEGVGYLDKPGWRGDVPPLPEGQAHFFRRQSWDECVREFPTCDLSVGSALACQAHAQTGDPFFFDADAPAHCTLQRTCLWGIETVSGPAPESWSKAE